MLWVDSGCSGFNASAVRLGMCVCVCVCALFTSSTIIEWTEETINEKEAKMEWHGSGFSIGCGAFIHYFIQLTQCSLVKRLMHTHYTVTQTHKTYATDERATHENQTEKFAPNFVFFVSSCPFKCSPTHSAWISVFRLSPSHSLSLSLSVFSLLLVPFSWRNILQFCLCVCLRVCYFVSVSRFLFLTSYMLAFG